MASPFPTILHEHVLKTLLYYDIFNYPLKAHEVYRFLGMNSIKEHDVISALCDLKEAHQVYQFNDLYSLINNEENIERRIRGNKEAEKYLTIAFKQAYIIGSFPFVRAVMASGSLSKGYMDDQSDLDFFIVTKPGRLWIARMLLVLYKRIFLGNSHKYFCVNYFIDEDHLEIEEKNLFTATELATVIPLVNEACYHRLLHSNVWIKKIFPNIKPLSTTNTLLPGSSLIKSASELILNCVASWLDPFCMKLTVKRWKKLYGDQFSSTDFKIAFKSNKHSSKSHPLYYQKKVIQRYEEKLKSYQEKFNMQFTS